MEFNRCFMKKKWRIILFMILLCYCEIESLDVKAEYFSRKDLLNIVGINQLEAVVSFPEIVYVKEENELINALKNNEIKRVILQNDIKISSIEEIEIYGNNKFIDGNGYNLVLENETTNIVAKDYIENITNLNIHSQSMSTLVLKAGGNIQYLIAPNVKIESKSSIDIEQSEMIGLDIIDGSESKIFNSIIYDLGLTVERSYNVQGRGLNIYPTYYNNGISAYRRSSLDIKDTNIYGGTNGIYASLNGQTMTLENVNIEGSEKNGIYNDGDVNGSYLSLNNVSIENVGEHGIYNTGSYSQGEIYLEDQSTLKLAANNMGIYLKSGRLKIGSKAIIDDLSKLYTVSKDINSNIYDEEERLKLVKSNNQIEYYNTMTKEEVSMVSREVSDEKELKEALANEEINEVKILNNIELSEGKIEVGGVLKSIIGNGNTISLKESDFLDFESKDYVEVSDLEINAQGTMKFLQGGGLSNVRAENIDISSYAPIEVLKTELNHLNINNGQKSKVIDSKILGSMSIYQSLDILIEGTEIRAPYGNTLTVSQRTSGVIKNTHIYGGTNGIYASLNGKTITLENVNIEGSKENGIYNDGDVNGSYLSLNNVSIENVGKHGIYNTGSHSQGEIVISADSVLKLDFSKLGILLEYGRLIVEGELIHDSSSYTVISDYQSEVVDISNQLKYIPDDTSSDKKYIINPDLFNYLDLNEDGVINQKDLKILSNYYNLTNEHANWNSALDLNQDGIIDLYDFIIISKRITN